MITLKDEYATRVARWYMGTFPINSRDCISKGGLEAERALIKMRELTKLKEWNNGEEDEIKDATDLLKRIQPTSWRRKRNIWTADYSPQSNNER